MPNRFEVPSDDTPPSTPDRSSRSKSSLFHFHDGPSTTPAGPPPSSAASFTPAGAPTASYLGSSVMREVTAQQPLNFGRTNSGGSASGSQFTSKSNSPLGRSVRLQGRQPSRLSRQVAVDDDDDAEEEEEEEDLLNARRPPRTFDVHYGEDSNSQDDHPEDSTQGDMWLDMDQDSTAELPAIGDESDLMMLVTPAVNDRIRREAEDMFRVSAMRSSGRRPRQFRFAPVAKGIYTQMGYATVTEAPQVVLETEALVSRLYDDGIGTQDDPERLDKALGETSAHLASLWQAYIDSLPTSDQEHAAGIGPGPHASPFKNAVYLATLALRVNHTRFEGEEQERTEPLPGTMFRWLADSHNLYQGQIQEVLKCRPGAASHGMFWQTVFISLLQGRVAETVNLLRAAGWQNIRQGAHLVYTGRALANVQRAVRETIDMLENCPGQSDNWDVWSSDWTLFRIRTKGALDQLRKFAEGKGPGEPDFADPGRGRNSMAGLARKAESQVPWDVYENLNIIFDIALGSRERIIALSQDWCEATVGLFGWWDEGKDGGAGPPPLSQSLVLATPTSTWESYLDRLARSFQSVVDAGLEVNSNSPLEVGMACVFEENPKGVIGLLRAWSLPVATAVAEIASLGGWLPQHQPSDLLGMEELDADDLEVLGLDPTSPDEMDGIKDNTLVQYAEALVNYPELSSVEDRFGKRADGWELAIHVLGRMESPARSEEIVGQLVRGILDKVDVESEATVEKVWKLLNDLGMIAFAEETAEQYGEILAQGSHRYGEAMWYYALAHRPNKVREVMNLLTSYSLMQSAAYPPESDLDEHLANLLIDRNITLAKFAKQDLEAANLLGKMLSGYATLRAFYRIRDDESIPPARRRVAAATALTAVIASADDNIRGGLYDGTRDAVVSEDFLLALLGEAVVLVDSGDKPCVSLDAVDVLLKAVEDIQTVGSRVYTANDEFFQLVLQSAPGLRGSKPSDLLRKSTSSLSGTSSYVMTGSSIFASQLHRSLSGGSGGVPGRVTTKRGWDWRSGLTATSAAEDVLRRLRLGLTRDLAKLWIMDADGGF